MSRCVTKFTHPDEKVFDSTIKDFFLNRCSKLSKSLTTRFADNFQIIQNLHFESRLLERSNQQQKYDEAKLRNDFGRPR